MNSTTIPTTLVYFSPPPAAFTESSSKRQAHNPRHVQLKLDKRQNGRNFLSKSIKCTQNRGIRNPTALASCLAATEAPPSKVAELVADKLKRLVLEFRSLAEPIDRVKRLLHYAAGLPPYNESTRKPESRVPGCSTQVWVEAEMDELGRMRFRADSDSEISKGFCSCLIWMLDGAEAAEVLEVKTRDLEDVNVGVYGKVNSRVNTWHNVLLAMQRKTQALVTEREGKRPLEALPSLLASTNESYESPLFSLFSTKNNPKKDRTDKAEKQFQGRMTSTDSLDFKQVAQFLHVCGLAKATSSLTEL